MSVTGDFNGDGRTDILFTNTRTGDGLIWYMDGTEIRSSARMTSTIEKDWVLSASGDYNSDGIADIVIRNTLKPVAEHRAYDDLSPDHMDVTHNDWAFRPGDQPTIRRCKCSCQ